MYEQLWVSRSARTGRNGVGAPRGPGRVKCFPIDLIDISGQPSQRLIKAADVHSDCTLNLFNDLVFPIDYDLNKSTFILRSFSGTAKYR